MNEQSFPNDEPLKALQAMSALHSCSSCRQFRPAGLEDGSGVKSSARNILTQSPIMTPAEVLAHDVKQAAVHEGGHYIIAEHYDLSCRITLNNEQEVIGDKYREYTTVKGQITLPITNNRFLLSVTAWGGLLAEVLVSEGITDPEVLAAITRDQINFGEISISHTDEEYIHSHPQPWRALKVAARIVMAKRARIDEITRLAMGQMIDQGQLSFHYPPLPDHATT